MYPASHAASAAVINRLLFGEHQLLPTVAGALLPDAIDKTLCWVLKVTDSSHHVAHTPLAALGFSVLATRCFGTRWSKAFGTAYLLHLAGDEFHHGRVPWFMPISSRKRREGGATHSNVFLALEAPSSALLLWLMARAFATQTGESDLAT